MGRDEGEGRRVEVRTEEERKILEEIHIADHLQGHRCSSHVQCRLASLGGEESQIIDWGLQSTARGKGLNPSHMVPGQAL